MTDERSARYSDLFESRHDHGSDCAYCPFCSAIGVLRKTNPDVLEHLAGAARELLAAASILIQEAERVVATPQEGDPAATADDAGRLRRIDVG